jgi:hypothetical protein
VSTLVLFWNPHGGEAAFLGLLLLENVGKIDEETFHAESSDQMHNEDRSNSRRPSDVNDAFFRNRSFFLQLIDPISRALFLQFLLVWVVRVAAIICFLKIGKNWIELRNNYACADLGILLFLLTFDQVYFREFKLRETHEDDRGQTNKEQLEGPKAQMRYRRKSVEANILTTGLVCIAFEISLKHNFCLYLQIVTYAFISINRSTNDSDDEGPECEEQE